MFNRLAALLALFLAIEARHKTADTQGLLVNIYELKEKLHIFTSGVGREQNRDKIRVNFGTALTRWAQRRFLMNANNVSQIMYISNCLLTR